MLSSKMRLSDKRMKICNADAHGYVTTIDAGLADSLPEADVAPAAAFIMSRACLRPDPKKRLLWKLAITNGWRRPMLVLLIRYTCKSTMTWISVALEDHGLITGDVLSVQLLASTDRSWTERERQVQVE